MSFRLTPPTTGYVVGGQFFTSKMNPVTHKITNPVLSIEYPLDFWANNNLTSLIYMGNGCIVKHITDSPFDMVLVPLTFIDNREEIIDFLYQEAKEEGLIIEKPYQFINAVHEATGKEGFALLSLKKG